MSDEQNQDNPETSTGPLIIVAPSTPAEAPRTLRTHTPTKTGDKMEGQCSAPGCLSTREPNGARYLCPVHAPKQ